MQEQEDEIQRSLHTMMVLLIPAVTPDKVIVESEDFWIYRSNF